MVSTLKNSSRIKKGLVLLFVLALTMVLIPVQTTHASATVSNCNVSNSLPVPGNLAFALNQGGTINFSCSGTMALPITFTVTKNTIIDGAGQTIIISGLQSHRIFLVKPGVTLTLKNITLIQGWAVPSLISSADRGGAILNDGGKVVLNNVTLQNNRALKGGAIYSLNDGSVKITNSTLTGNATHQGSYWHDYNGGAIYMAGGTLDIDNSTFEKNKAYFGGAIFNNKSQVNITFSKFRNNSTQGTVNTEDVSGGDGSEQVSKSVDDAEGASGGAIYSNNYLTVDNTTFEDNTADYAGGAVVTAGGKFTASLFYTNHVSYGSGGAIKNRGTLYIYNNNFEYNTAHNGEGGAIFNSNLGSIVMFEDYVKYNTTNEAGGAISNRGNYLEVRSSLFDTNVAGTTGGAIYDAKGLANIINTTFNNNAATKGSQFMVEHTAEVVLINSTISSDKTPTNSVILNNGKVTLTNTIVSNYTGSVNCAGNAVVDNGNNLQYPKLSCGMMTSKDPLLSAPVSNGGNVPTMALKPGSPAIDAGNNAVCGGNLVNNRDARGFTRPVDGDNNGKAVCDIGAFEAGSVQGK